MLPYPLNYKLILMKSLLNFIFINLTCIGFSFAQSAVSKPESFFNASIQQQSRLYNGLSYLGYGSNVDGSANFQDLNTFSKGSVVYDGFRFENTPLMYDLNQDKLVSLLGEFSKYSLISNKVTEFHLNDHHFTYINVIDTTTSVIKSGFFDLIYNGNTKILVKRSKSMETSINDNMIRYYFVPKTYYYIARDQKYEVISSEKSFLNFFKDKKIALKKRLKESKIKFRKQPEAAMILLASYYEHSEN